MSPEKFKSDVQTAYKRAIANRNSWTHHNDQSHRIFDGIVVFGREAGIDLIQTVIGSILHEAVHAAEAKQTALTLRPGKTGKAAIAGMVETLQETTGLLVSETNGVITIALAKDEPDLY